MHQRKICPCELCARNAPTLAIDHANIFGDVCQKLNRQSYELWPFTVKYIFLKICCELLTLMRLAKGVTQVTHFVASSSLVLL